MVTQVSLQIPTTPGMSVTPEQLDDEAYLIVTQVSL